MKLKKCLVSIILSILLIIAINEVYQIKLKINTNNNWKVSIKEEDNSNNLIDIKENNISKLQTEYENSDIKGIITIENESEFSYPIVQSSNNEYYLTHNYKREYDALGAIYADYRVDLDNSNKLLIFGHSSTKRNVPFNILENYYDKEYYDSHKYITIETKKDTYKYEIFSVYVETSDFTYMNLNFDTKENWYSHIIKLKSKSLYDTNIDLSIDDNILILQTCSNNLKYQNYSKKYLLIVSRRVK